MRLNQEKKLANKWWTKRGKVARLRIALHEVEAVADSMMPLYKTAARIKQGDVRQGDKEYLLKLHNAYARATNLCIDKGHKVAAAGYRLAFQLATAAWEVSCA